METLVEAWVTTRKIIPIQVKHDCEHDGHRFGGTDSHGFKTCSECGLSVRG